MLALPEICETIEDAMVIANQVNGRDGEDATLLLAVDNKLRHLLTRIKSGEQVYYGPSTGPDNDAQ